MHRGILALLLFAVMVPAARAQYQNQYANGPLVQSTTNSRYFVPKGSGQAVFLVGSHTWNDFLDIGLNGSPQTFDFNYFVNFLKSHGHNATILWRKDLPVECGWINGTDTETPFPWNRPGPGNASDGGLKFDLTSFNQAFFDRLSSRVAQLWANGIYVVVQLFDGNNVTSARCGTNTSPNGDGFPFTGANNINSVDDGYTGGGNTAGVGAFTMSATNAETNAEDAFVVQVLTTLNQYPNVIYELAEEEPGSHYNGTPGYGGAESIAFWATHIRNLVKTVEAGGTFNSVTYPGMALQHPVGIGAMNSLDVNDDGASAEDALLYSSNMDWVAPTINGTFSNQFPSNVPTNNQGKMILNDSDHSYDAATLLNSNGTVNDPQARNYLWENVTSGAAGVLFMDPYTIDQHASTPIRNTCSTSVSNGICTNNGLDSKWEPFRNALGYVLKVMSQIDPQQMTPQSSLCSTMWCLVKNTELYSTFVVYQTDQGSFTVNLTAQLGRTLNVQWLNPSTGALTKNGTVAGGSATQSFTSPWNGTCTAGTNCDAVLLLTDPQPPPSGSGGIF